MDYRYKFTYVDCQTCKARVNCQECEEHILKLAQKIEGWSICELKMNSKMIMIQIDSDGANEDDILNQLEEYGIFVI